MILYGTKGNAVNSPEIVNYPDSTMKINAPLGNVNKNESIEIVWLYENDVETLVLIYLVNNLKERYKNPFELYMPYLPNARMDRTHENHEVFTLKYFAKLINDLDFEKVTVLDAHSSVGEALINNINKFSPDEFIQKSLKDINFDRENDYVFFPDEGSCKRYSNMFSGFKHIGFGIKKRDWATGEIKGLDVYGDDPKDRRVFIIDDICSFGGTVYYSAKKLKELGCKDINVFFSHCEKSILAGKLTTCGLISKIFTTNSTFQNPSTDMITVYDCYTKNRIPTEEELKNSNNADIHTIQFEINEKVYIIDCNGNCVTGTVTNIETERANDEDNMIVTVEYDHPICDAILNKKSVLFIAKETYANCSARSLRSVVNNDITYSTSFYITPRYMQQTVSYIEKIITNMNNN